MPTRIRVPHRIAHHVPIPIPRQRIIHPRHHRIRAEERAYQRVVEASAVVIQLQPRFESLAGEQAVGGQGAALLDDGAVGRVLDAADPSTSLRAGLVAALVGEQAGGTGVVGEEEKGRGSFPQPDLLTCYF